MKVTLQPISGTPAAYRDRARAEIERVLNFRRKVVRTTVAGKNIEVKIEINPDWDLPMAEKVEALKLWIPAKVRTVFKVTGVG